MQYSINSCGHATLQNPESKQLYAFTYILSFCFSCHVGCLVLWCRSIKNGCHFIKTDLEVTRKLASHPPQGECRRAAAECPGCWPPTFPQWVLDCEVVCVLLQRVVQRVHQAILPQLVKHQCGENLRQARNSAIKVIRVNATHLIR